MPIVLKKQIEPLINIGIWHLTETVEQIEPLINLFENEKIYYNNIKNDKRKREWLVARVLLARIIEKQPNIKYSKYGKPFLVNNDNINISITHSKNYVGVILANNKKVGIDIETISDRVENVKHKFLNNRELEWCNTQEFMTICWSAKETIFKIYEKELDFHDIIIDEIKEKDKFLRAIVIKNNENIEFKVPFFKIKNDVITYTML